MAVTVTKLYDGLSLHFQNAVGGITQRYLVEGLSATNDPADLLNAGIANCGVSYTQAHPTISGIYAATFDAKPFIDSGGVSKTAVVVEVTFSTPTFLPLGGVKVEISGSNSQFILNRWPGGPLKGQPILVGYYPDRTKTPPGLNSAGQIDPHQAVLSTMTISSGGYQPQGWAYDQVEIPIESPNALLILTRTEFAFPRNGFTYRRTLNQNAWLGFDPLTVLLRDVRAQNIIGAGVIAPTYYVVTYVFEIVPDPNMWLQLAVFRDEHTGKNVIVDTNSQTFNGYTQVYPYMQTDFTGLKFPTNLLA